MKATISGKTYNTQTADLIGEWHNGYSSRDFDFCVEYLYRTAKGKFFIHGEGGARSKYATSSGNSFGGGSSINPLSDEQALAWLERYCPDSDAIQEHFGSMIEEA